MCNPSSYFPLSLSCCGRSSDKQQVGYMKVSSSGKTVAREGDSLPGAQKSARVAAQMVLPPPPMFSPMGGHL